MVSGASWDNLRSFGGILQASWAVFGGAWGILGGSLAVLGGLGCVLGGSWGPWVDFCRFKLNKPERRVGTWPMLRPNMRLKRHPKCTKIGDKNYKENKSLSKTVLERSWAHLGPILGHSDLQNRALA